MVTLPMATRMATARTKCLLMSGLTYGYRGCDSRRRDHSHN